ncbi:MAG: sialidase family protein [Candidatus Polarisedimenticolia bacterium]
MLIHEPLTPPAPSPIITSADHLRACSDGNGNIYAVWAQVWLYPGENPFFPIEVPEIYLAASHDGGQSYSAAVNISQEENGLVPAVACHAGGQVIIGFYDPSDTDRGFWYRVSTDYGLSFGPRARIPRSPEMATEASWTDLTFLEDGSLAAAWEAARTGDFNSEVFAAHSGDHGSTWTEPVNISLDPAHSQHPSIAANSDGRILVAWEDSREAYFHVYGRVFDPREQEWSMEIRRLSWEDSSDQTFTESALSPALAAGPHDEFWITWVDGFHRFEPSYRVGFVTRDAQLVQGKVRHVVGGRVLDGYTGTFQSSVASAAGRAIGIAWDACPQLYCVSDSTRVYFRLLQKPARSR